MSFKIPFGLLPGAWGLKGTVREMAKAEYELTGEAKERRLAELRYNKDSIEYKKRMLEIDFEFEHISQFEFEKQAATLHGVPWFQPIDVRYERLPGGSGRFHFEYDWNDLHIEELRKQGYEGYTEEEIIENWLIESARQVLPDPYSITEQEDVDRQPTRATRKRSRGGKTEYS